MKIMNLKRVDWTRRRNEMSRIKGLFINLEDSKERRKRIERHIEELNLNVCYKRFSAIRGEVSEARERGLTEGELGLWKTWISLLNEVVNIDKNFDFDYLHVLEDDAIISKSLGKEISNKATELQNYDLIVTDMYVNEQIWRTISTIVESLKKEKKTALLNEYTGCLSSVLIPKESIHKVYMQLERVFNRTKKLLPIDNTLIALSKEERLKIACTLPFMSTVEISDIRNSNIQEYDDSQGAIILTQQVNALLRTQLSYLSGNVKSGKILDALEKLAELEKEKIVPTVIRYALEKAQMKNLFRYKIQERLKGQPGNQQYQ